MNGAIRHARRVSGLRSALAATAALILFVAVRVGTAGAQYTGDCDGSETIEINELVIGVNISLGSIPLSSCQVFDADHSGMVEIYELIAAVGSALNGCTAGPASKSNKSSPIAVSPDGTRVVAVNTDTDTMSVFEVGQDGQLSKLKEVAVGNEPRSVALLPNKPWAYVANAVSGTVQVISLLDYSTVATVTVGTEPWAVVASPNGLYVYAANTNSNSVSAIDTGTNTVIATIPVGRSPRALAITNAGDADDLDERLFVPNFYARARAGFTPPSSAGLGGGAGPTGAFPMGAAGQAVIGEGIFDDSREGVIDVVSTGTNQVVDHVVLAPFSDTGFKVARGAFVSSIPGDAPRTIFADGGTDGTQPQLTGAFPNLLLSVALLNGRGFVPNSAASPEPPLRFNVNVQSLLSVLDTGTDQEIVEQTFNLNKGINFDVPANLSEAQNRDNTDRLFPSAPVDIDCSAATNRCWVVSQGSDFVVRMYFDAQGAPTINAPTMMGPFDVSPVVRIPTIDPQDPCTSAATRAASPSAPTARAATSSAPPRAT
jgi:YVTN family beta-propeller protein